EVGLGDLPAATQEWLRGHLRSRLVHQFLDAAERRAVAGGAPLAPTVERALVDAIRALPHGGPSHGERVAALADLLELLGHPVPYDAQTALYRVRATLPQDQAAALEPLARRLGLA
ncbi:MAG TPA: hypothetical protein VD793_09235, partial [Gemmatimonadales bacterium]|nr:hypothetical protein [Gemmatimonadales bacterium]